jgi:hypothetical protein
MGIHRPYGYLQHLNYLSRLTCEGLYDSAGSKSFVDATFNPRSLVNARRFRPNEKSFPTMVLQVAYRHQTFGDLRSSAAQTYLREMDIQVFIGVKVYDDDKFQVFVQTRYDHGGYDEDYSDVYVRDGKLRSITEFTGEKISIPAKALCGASVGKRCPDFVLDVEMLRYILGTTGTVGPKKGREIVPLS